MKKTSKHLSIPHPGPWTGSLEATMPRINAPKADTHPCQSCLALCCYFVLIEASLMENDEDLDAIGEQLNYHRLVGLVEPDGNCTVGLITPCRLFDRTTFGCGAHKTPAQPDICVQYSARNCWYRPIIQHHGVDMLRLTGDTWGAFRDQIDVEALPLLPNWDDIQAPARGARSYTEPVTIWFDLPEDSVDDSAGLGDLLYYFSNFQGCQLALTEDGWYLLADTLRAADATASDFEVIAGAIERHAAADQVRPHSEQLLVLSKQFGRALFYMKPAAVAKALSDLSE